MLGAIPNKGMNLALVTTRAAHRLTQTAASTKVTQVDRAAKTSKCSSDALHRVSLDPRPHRAKLPNVLERTTRRHRLTASEDERTNRNKGVHLAWRCGAPAPGSLNSGGVMATDMMNHVFKRRPLGSSELWQFGSVHDGFRGEVGL